MSFKNIYLVFSKTGTLFSHLISLCTHEEYAHVSLSLDDSFTKMYSFGRINPAKVLPAGFVYENLYDGVFAMFPESKCLIYKVNVTEKQYNNLVNEIRLFENNKDNLKYNILGTSLVYFNRPRKRESKWQATHVLLGRILPTCRALSASSCSSAPGASGGPSSPAGSPTRPTAWA